MSYIHQSVIQCFSIIPWLDPSVLFHTSVTCSNYWSPTQSPMIAFFKFFLLSRQHPSPAFFVVSLCSCTGGLYEVCDHHLGFPELLHTSTHRPDHTLQSPIESLQVEFSQNGSKWISVQRLSHHITETILWLHQQLQPQQRRALNPEKQSVPHESSDQNL